MDHGLFQIVFMSHNRWHKNQNVGIKIPSEVFLYKNVSISLGLEFIGCEVVDAC
jgi:hypothetical protein